jgi:hypothetical protein
MRRTVPCATSPIKAGHHLMNLPGLTEGGRLSCRISRSWHPESEALATVSLSTPPSCLGEMRDQSGPDVDAFSSAAPLARARQPISGSLSECRPVSIRPAKRRE